MNEFKDKMVSAEGWEGKMRPVNVNGMFFADDPVSPAKVLKEFAQKTKKTEVLGGIADGVALTADEAKAYAELPSYEELMAQLVYVIASPISGLMSVLNGPARGMAVALQAISEQKQAA